MDLFDTDDDADRIWIEYVGTIPADYEVLELSFSREVYLVEGTSDYTELPDYKLQMDYILIDCAYDFEVPTNFLTPVSTSNEADGLLNSGGSGLNFLSFFEEGIQKTYNLILSQPE